eukprot:4312157-Prymnesium_polylepis.1
MAAAPIPPPTVEELSSNSPPRVLNASDISWSRARSFFRWLSARVYSMVSMPTVSGIDGDRV